MFLKRLQKRLQIRELAQAVLPHHFPKFAQMTEQELQAESEGGAVVLDIRHSVAFEEGHFPGSLNVGLASREFVLCVGLFLSKQNRIFLVVDQSEQARRARLELSRAGFDQVGGFIEAGRLMEVHMLTQLSVFDLKSTLCRGGKPEILDVRSTDEWKSSEIPESKNIPLAQLTSRVSELSSAKPLVVVCQDGYRSAVASSWLQAYGFDSVQYLLGGMDAYGSAPLNECVAEFA
jgi:hydroxyacylglutathione hydrolase